jgi:hypothetical protein
MTGGTDLHIGNAAHLRHWSLTGRGDACPSATKMLRSGLLSPGQCRAPTIFGRHHDIQHLAEIIAQKCQHGSPMTKATSKSP